MSLSVADGTARWRARNSRAEARCSATVHALLRGTVRGGHPIHGCVREKVTVASPSVASARSIARPPPAAAGRGGWSGSSGMWVIVESDRRILLFLHNQRYRCSKCVSRFARSHNLFCHQNPRCPPPCTLLTTSPPSSVRRSTARCRATRSTSRMLRRWGADAVFHGAGPIELPSLPRPLAGALPLPMRTH